MRALFVLMVLINLATNSYGIVLNEFLEVKSDTGIVISREAAEGCYRCGVELKMARDSLGTYIKIEAVTNETIDFIVAEVSGQRKIVVWWNRSKNTLKDVGIGILIGVMLVKLPP